jgi:hypothetical protein
MEGASVRGKRHLWAGIGLTAVAVVTLAAMALASTRSTTTHVPAGAQRFGHVGCPAGQHVRAFGIYGQFAQYGESESDLPLELALTDPSHVIGGARGTAASHAGSFDTFARCGHARGLFTTPASKEGTDVAAGEQTSVKAKCPRGSAVRLGGFRQELGPDSSSPFVMTNGLQRTSSRTWKVSAINLGNATGHLSAFAYCGDPVRHVVVVTKSRTLEEGQYGTATAHCAHGSRLLMGGLHIQHYATYFDDIYVTAMEPTGPRSWSVTGFKYAPAPGHMTAIAYCRG